MKTITERLLFLSVMICSPGVQASTVTVGTFNSGSCDPLMCNNSGTAAGQSIDYQQVYSAAAFNGPLTINLIGWYYDANTAGTSTLLGGLYNVYWGYAAFGSVNDLSVNLASNFISGRTQIASILVPAGGISDNPGINLSLDAAQQFTYDPARGNLLLEISVSNQDNVPSGGGNGNNEADSTGALTSSAYCIPGHGCVASPIGLVNTFSTPVPESSTLTMAGIAMLAAIVSRSTIPKL